MSIRKTLGGDRLGSGKKMKVDLHGYERSTHDLGYLWRSTMSSGTLVPFMSQVALPGDTWDIDLGCDIKTHPTVGPLFGSFKVQLDVFQCPIRLYNSLLHNNALGIGMNMSKVKFPVIRVDVPNVDPITYKDIDNAQVNPSCILAYLGIRGYGISQSNDVTRDFNAIPILAYWEVYKQYYANKSEEVGAVIHTNAVANVTTVSAINYQAEPNGPLEGIPVDPTIGYIQIAPGRSIELTWATTEPIASQIYFNTTLGIKSLDQIADFVTTNGTTFSIYQTKGNVGFYAIENWRYKGASDISEGEPTVVTFPLVDIDYTRKALLAHSSETEPFVVNETRPGSLIYEWTTDKVAGRFNSLSTQEGLGIKTYQSDLFNNWIDTEWITGSTGVNAISAVSTAGGSFSMDTLNLAQKVYEFLNRIAVSGGTYHDWLEATWGEEKYRVASTPMYMGGLIKELVFQEVVSNTSSEDSPQGTLGGRGVLDKKHKGGHITIKVEEPSYILGIVSLTPRIDYSQGNKWDVHLKTMDDLHKPAFDEIGFQDLITEQLAWWDTRYENPKFVQKSAGKQPAWLNYMTNTNVVLGNFAIEDNEMFMTLNRRYEWDSTTYQIKDLTTYIDPSKFNHIFAETSLDAQNFWAQIAVDATVRRKMSAKVMPNL